MDKFYSGMLFLTLSSSFIGAMLALLVFWAGTQTTKYERDRDVPWRLWAAIFIPPPVMLFLFLGAERLLSGLGTP